MSSEIQENSKNILIFNVININQNEKTPEKQIEESLKHLNILN